VIEALRHPRSMPGPVAIHTDSTYVIRGITQWIHGWRRRGWTTAEGAPVLNRELWEQLAELVVERGRGGVKWHYVRGHAAVPGNEPRPASRSSAIKSSRLRPSVFAPCHTSSGEKACTCSPGTACLMARQTPR